MQLSDTAYVNNLWAALVLPDFKKSMYYIEK